MIKIEDIWNKVVEQEPDDPPIRIKTNSVQVAYSIKQKLSSYKHRILNRDDALRDALGEFKLVYAMATINGVTTLSITVEYETGTTVEAEFA